MKFDRQSFMMNLSHLPFPIEKVCQYRGDDTEEACGDSDYEDDDDTQEYRENEILRVKSWAAELDRIKHVLVSRSEVAFGAALRAWRLIGRTLARYADAHTRVVTYEGQRVRIKSEVMNDLESLLFGVHKEAIRVLVDLCVRHQIDAEWVEAAGVYCREILFAEINLKEPTGRPSLWYRQGEDFPECFELLALPGDVRSAIVSGNAEVNRLKRLLTLERQRNSNADTGLNAVSAKHSIDYRSVSWNGQKFKFTKLQAACVKVLWAAYEDGTPMMAGDTVLEEAESARDDGRLAARGERRCL